MSENSENKIRGSTDEETEMKRIFSKNLKWIMKQRGYSARSLATELGVSHVAVLKWLKGVNLPRSGTLQQISQALMCDMTDLIKENGVFVNLEGSPDDGESLPEKLEKLPGVSRSIPIYDSVSCGKGSFVDEEIVDTMKLPAPWVKDGIEYFANQAQGNSMEPLISDGDYLVFERCDSVQDGMIGAFSLNGEYYCKRIRKCLDNYYWLFSENTRYPPIKIEPEDDFRCLGVLSFKIMKTSIH